MYDKLISINEKIDHILEQMKVTSKRINSSSSENEKIMLILHYGRKKAELDSAYLEKYNLIVNNLNVLPQLLDFQNSQKTDEYGFKRVLKKFFK